ncbi:microtubule-associated protein 9 [Hippoglossus hippoglossus]|uniref:microtubule-associated protein 9 n=1 Tax=Hippoglossus hippoglossus TaxID=8267 RepID=UPI00148DDCE0|nr:microtubule-associated protein 9 [Hippoglossus hippoglossus]
MTNQEVRTLAYSKSPKTSRRTTFQDELQAAVSARANKTTTGHFSYPDDFDEDEDEDDFFNQLLKSRKKKADAFKAGKSKANTHNTFDLSDDKDKHGKTKRVSFLKSKRISFSSEDASESRENEQPDSSVVGHYNHNNSISSQHSTSGSKYDTQSKNSVVEPVDPQTPRGSLSRSLSYQTSDDLLDMPLPLPPDGSVTETPGPEEKSNTFLEETSQTPDLSGPDIKHVPSADIPTEREPPKPKPRQRTLGLLSHAVEKTPEESESQDLSRPQTSSASIPLSSGASSNTAVRSCSPHWTEDDHTFSHSLSKSSSSKSEQSQFLTKSTIDSESRGDFISDDSKDRDGKCSTSFEEFHEDLGDHSNQSVAQLSHTQEKLFDTRTSSSNSKITQRCQSACSRKVESKYLGSLKVLDRKVSLHESPPETADSLRAAVYQEWLKKKKEKSLGNAQLKKKEQLLQEQKKKEEEAKKGDAVASYEAWKEGKAESLKAKAKEKQDKMRKEQRAGEETEEKKQSAKQVFEKWKQEQDHLLDKKYRKQKEAEDKLQLKKQTKEEERKRESTSAFSRWSDKKKDVIHEKVSMERKEVKDKAEEERYMKEERDKMALEMYESWLVRKEREQKRQREERRIKAILRDSPPPPWSPPNKTIGFRK